MRALLFTKFNPNNYKSYAKVYKKHIRKADDLILFINEFKWRVPYYPI